MNNAGTSPDLIVETSTDPQSKTCPFCAEQVREEAIKCRHCHSMLLPGLTMVAPESSSLPAKPTGTVTYVVDEGIIKFGKFATAVLTIFVLLGVYVFQIDIRQTAKELEKARSDMLRSREELAKTSTAALATINQSTGDVRRLAASARAKEAEMAQTSEALGGRADMMQTLIDQSEATSKAAVARSMSASSKAQVARATAESAVAKVEASLLRAELGVGEIEALRDDAAKQLGREDQVRLAERQNEDPNQFRTSAEGGQSKLWRRGTVLTVRFLDGTDVQHNGFRNAMALWLAHANLTVNYGDDPAAKLRVSFRQAGSWSFVGTDALGLEPGKPTINLGFANPGAPPPNYIHEIGHALGLVHETSNPNAALDFDKAAIYALLGGPPNNWDRPTVDANIFRKFPYPGTRSFDRASIMNQGLPGSFFKNGQGIAAPTTLSTSDKSYIAALYPRT